MTVARFRAVHSHLFYREQTWFLDEAFMQAVVPTGKLSAPTGAIANGQTPKRHDVMLGGAPLPSLAELVAQYVQHSTALIWRRYLWTTDCDRHGQRVFVGDNGYGLEIHRHLTISERWGAPIWR